MSIFCLSGVLRRIYVSKKGIYYINSRKKEKRHVCVLASLFQVFACKESTHERTVFCDVGSGSFVSWTIFILASLFHHSLSANKLVLRKGCSLESATTDSSKHENLNVQKMTSSPNHEWGLNTSIATL